MADVDISEGAREYVDISAQAISGLGQHLAIIGGIISKGVLPPDPGDRGTAQKVKEKYEIYQKYSADIARRKNEIEAKMVADFERLRLWRKSAGTEGASLIEELQMYMNKTRELSKLLMCEYEKLAEEKEKVQFLIKIGIKKDLKWKLLTEGFIKKKNELQRDIKARAGFSSWLQCAFDEMKFRWKAEREHQKLRIEHHQRMRKARCQARLDVIQRERMRRVQQMCMLALQEESVEGRSVKLLEELRRRHDDEILVLNGQIALALGDEERAKALIA